MQQAPVFDINLHEYYQKRALKNFQKNVDFLLTYAGEEILERLSAVKRDFAFGLDIFGYHGRVGEILARAAKIKKMGHVHNNRDFAHKNLCFYESLREHMPCYFLESENAEKIDLAICPFVLHMVNDILPFLTEIRRSLKPDGLFMAVLPGVGSLRELRTVMIEVETTLYQGVNPRILPFIDIKDAGMLLQKAGFALPVVDREDLILHYDNAFALFADLRHMGMQNILHSRSKKPLSRKFFQDVSKLYQEKYADKNGRIPVTLSLLWLLGWAPHKDQQKAAKRGSASISLSKYFSKNDL